MATNLPTVRAALDTHLKTVVFPGQPVHIQSVSDTTLLERSASGAVKPYVAYALGDLREDGNGSFMGPRGVDHSWPLYIKIVVPGSTAGITTGQQLYDRCIDLLLGTKFAWCSEVRKRAGGLTFPLKKTDGSIEAVIYPVSFGFTIQIA